MNSGLRMLADPRWVAVVPADGDARAAVAAQLGEGPPDVDATEWERLIDQISVVLAASVAGGAWWAGAFLVTEPDGGLGAAWASIEPEAVLGGVTSVDVDPLLEQLVFGHRNDEYRAELSIVDVPLGRVIRHHQVVAVDDEFVDYLAYLTVIDGQVVALRAMSGEIGWIGVWGAALETLLVSLHRAPDVPAGRLDLVTYVVGGVPA